MDEDRVEKVIQLALLYAGEAEDWKERDLGPIHLLKYAYLADLAHAERHGGSTFTGAAWNFFHFGPWEKEVHDRLDPALAKLGATKRQIESNYDKDWVRWNLSDESKLRELELELPTEVVSRLQKAVRCFGHDTSDLLHHVYLTEPMLHAAPGATLDFRVVAAKAREGKSTVPPISRRQQKKRKAVIEDLRERTKEKLRLKREAAKSASFIPPRFDEVFMTQVSADREASSPPVEGKLGVTFDLNVFGSETRSEGRD